MNSAHRLPPAEKPQLRLGYMRLTDSAPLVIAKELGLFAALDLDIPSPSKDYKEENRHTGGREFEAGIHLGADCQLLPDGDWGGRIVRTKKVRRA